MADLSEFTLYYDGGVAAQGRMDLYDASESYHGFARVIAILGHYYGTGKIISQAPYAEVELFLLPATTGSFKQTVLAGTVGAIVAAPFVSFVDHTVKSWLPSTDSDTIKIVELLKEQNNLLRHQMGLPDKITPTEKEAQKAVEQHIKQRQEEIDVLRSITSSSFRKVFRPVGRSVDVVGILAGKSEEPVGVVDEYALRLLESDKTDSTETGVTGIVNSFSRSSKTGIAFSNELRRGFRFEYVGASELRRRDIFSWSQYTGNEIRMVGYFVRFFDGTIKKFNVLSAEKIEDERE